MKMKLICSGPSCTEAGKLKCFHCIDFFCPDCAVKHAALLSQILEENCVYCGRKAIGIFPCPDAKRAWGFGSQVSAPQCAWCAPPSLGVQDPAAERYRAYWLGDRIYQIEEEENQEGK